MNTYLFSIHPKWCEKIFSGEKTIEVRKTAPKPPFKVVVYCTKGNTKIYLGKDRIFHTNCAYDFETGELLENILMNGKVIGEFICDKVEQLQYQTTIPCIKINENDEIEISGNTTVEPFYNGKVKTIKESCLTQQQLLAYGQGKTLYALQITAPKLYDKPKELGEFYRLDDSGDDCCCGCIYHEIPMNEYPCCKCNGDRKYLTHAPQSYMRIQDPKEM